MGLSLLWYQYIVYLKKWSDQMCDLSIEKIIQYKLKYRDDRA